MSTKYPRTPHLPWSPGGTRDDRRIEDVSPFLGVPVVCTEKLDGSNVCLTSGQVYARSHSGAPAHPSFDALKALHAALRWQLPEHLSVFGEWCHAVHSIRYPEIPEGPELYVFGCRDDRDGKWLSWDDTKGLASTLGVWTAPALWEGSCATAGELENLVKRHARERSTFGPEREGVVLRRRSAFPDDEFSTSVGKWVREDHVQTDEHWSARQVQRHR